MYDDERVLVCQKEIKRLRQCVRIPVKMFSASVAALMPTPASASTLKSRVLKSSFRSKNRIAKFFIFLYNFNFSRF